MNRTRSLVVATTVLLLLVGGVVTSAVGAERASDGYVEFNQGVYVDERGDIVTFTLELDDTDTATVSLGSHEVGYKVNFTVVDGSDGDRSVTIEFNTLLTSDGRRAFSARTGDGASEPDRITQFEVKNGAPGVLANLSYPLLAWSGDTAQGISDDEASVVIESAGDPTVSTMTAPQGMDRAELTDQESIEDHESVTPTNRFAVGDWLIYKFAGVPGLEGYLAATTAEDRDRQEAVFDIFTTDEPPYAVEITERDPGVNRDPTRLHEALSSEHTYVKFDDDANVVYLLINTTNELTAGPLRGAYNTSVQIGDFDLTSEFLDPPTNISQTVTFVPARVRITSPNAFARDDGTISGKTSLAPGTQLTVSVQTQGGVVPPFQGKASTTVTDNRTFSVSFDFADQSAGDTYRIHLQSGTRINITTQGVIQVDEPPNASFKYTPSSPNPDDTIQLNASGSTDDIAITDYEWDTDGDGTYGEYGEPSTKRATVSFDEEGTYTVRLRVTDSGGHTDTIQKTITVSNTPPQARFEYDRQLGDELTVMVNASGSTDPDGRIVEYEWYVDGEYATSGESATLDFREKGQYRVELVVVDNGDERDSVTRTVGVSVPPEADISVSKSLVATDRPVEFTAGKSTDPDGEIVSYRWDFDDGNTATGATVTHSFTEPGSYVVTLAVTDDSGITRKVTQTITVRTPPKLTVRWEPSRPADDELVTLTANVSRDVEQIRWDLDDDGTFEATGATVTHRFPDGGRKTIVVEAQTSDDITAITERTIRVKSVDPTANISWSPRVPRRGQTVVFRAESDDNIETYGWDFDNDGEIDKQGRKVTHQFGNQSKQVVTLRITDEYGDTATISRVVTLQRSATFDLRAGSGESEVGGTVLVTFRISNKLPDTPVIAKLTLNLPETGVSISGITSGEIAGPGSTTFMEVAPGDDRQFTLQLQFSSAGEYNINATAVYFIGSTESGDRREISVGPINVSVISITPATTATGRSETSNTTSTVTIPGLTLASAIAALLLLGRWTTVSEE